MQVAIKIHQIFSAQRVSKHKQSLAKRKQHHLILISDSMRPVIIDVELEHIEKKSSTKKSLKIGKKISRKLFQSLVTNYELYIVSKMCHWQNNDKSLCKKITKN